MKGKAIIVLIDCGATHNFISQRLVEELEFPLTSTTHYGIVMGNGVAVKGKGVCKTVVVDLSGLSITEDFLPLELVG